MQNSTSSVRQLVSIGINTKYNPTDRANSVKTDSKYDNDFLYEQLPDLVNPQFRPWYCKRFYALGKERALQLASIARADAKYDQRKLFSTLLKQG